MTDLPLEWAHTHPAPAAAVAITLTVVAAGAAWATARRLRRLDKPAVAVAAVAALLCTAYSADTAWRFAEHRLDMVDTTERAVLFAAGEVALLACALMARQHVRQTSTDTTTGTPGVPGALVWVITGVQLVPAFAEGGLLGGVIRGFFGPILAALLWHLAMGLEIRHARPAALSTGLLAVIAREARERALSRLGLAERGRTAAQLTRDRATATAVRLAARRWRGPLAKRRLAAAVARAAVATDPAQRERLLAELAARRGALALATLALPAPWQPLGTPVLAVPDTSGTPVLDVPEEPWTAVVPDGAELLPVVARPAPEPADEYTEYVWREVVPAGVHTLPLVAPEPAVPPASAAPAALAAAAGADPLLDQVAADYAGAITDGRPSVRELKAKYGIGQTRAQRLRDQLTTDTREKAHA